MKIVERDAALRSSRMNMLWEVTHLLFCRYIMLLCGLVEKLNKLDSKFEKCERGKIKDYFGRGKR